MAAKLTQTQDQHEDGRVAELTQSDTKELDREVTNTLFNYGI